jgi:hypothetical protein
MSKHTKWQLIEDGYHKESRLVNRVTGEVLGSVSGCNYDNTAPWVAFISTPKIPKDQHVGSYVTEAQAKKALEARVEILFKAAKGRSK